MSNGENRHIPRDSLFILADLRRAGEPQVHRIKVRNLSAGGMMGESEVRIARGETIAINLRNVGWVEGTIAWVQDNRFGVAFLQDIDPKVVRAPSVVAVEASPGIVSRRPEPIAPASPGPVRKII